MPQEMAVCSIILCFYLARSSCSLYSEGVHEKANPSRGGGAKPTGL
jgi:hypothetical protein